MKWQEGKHFEKTDSGYRCLKCGKEIASDRGLGPHLSSCWGKETPSPSPESSSSEQIDYPTYEETLLQILKKFGVAKASGIVEVFSRTADPHDVGKLIEVLKDARVNAGIIRLIAEYWARYMDIPLTPNDIWSMIYPYNPYYAPNPYFNPYYAPTSNAPFVTKEDLEKILDEKLKESKNSDVVKMLLEDRKILLDRVLSEKNSPSLTDQLRFIEMVAERLGYSKGGKNIFDLLDKGINTVDKRVEEGFKIMQGQLSSASFSYPAENLRTPEMRQQIAKKMTSGLNETLKFVKVVETEFLGMGSQKVKREMERK